MPPAAGPHGPTASELPPHGNFNRPPYPGEHLWTYYRNQGVPPNDIMAELHRDLDKMSAATGRKVVWVGHGQFTWPKVDGHSDTLTIWHWVAPYHS